ncbi:MAG: hypothetical protein JW812_00200 [Alphaproteobacteria bacterium]|nr:hypothetical protein [Alphaproteobacteria bacterium]MBN2779727.1 hypothetical protein [Alphaproteobacteria bacterium]
MKNTCFVQESLKVRLFETVEEVWFWCCKGQLLRESGSRFVRKSSCLERPCTIDDIVRLLVKLRFSGKFSGKHLDILEQYGKRFCPPDIYNPLEKDDVCFWDEGLFLLEQECLKKGFLEVSSYYD